MGRRLVVDVENTTRTVEKANGKTKLDLLPFSGHNSLVSVGIKDIDTKEVWYTFFHHKELGATPIDFKGLQDVLMSADLCIGHNLKHDIMWLRSSGFKFPDITIWDTAIAEYVLSKGNVARRFDLAGIAIERNLPHKKTELIDKYFEDGIGMESIPIATVEEYGRGDLDTTEALYFDQLDRLSWSENRSLLSTIYMMGEFSNVLAKWQANGIKIDKVELEKVREEYRQEQSTLVFRLEELARQYLGDTPFSLSSGEDKSVLLYSRRVRDKSVWKEFFHLGIDPITGNAKRRPRLTSSEFGAKIRELAPVEYKTSARHCLDCSGTGRVTHNKKDGSPGKALRICKLCDGNGIIYDKLKRIAGFKLVPDGVADVAVNGFVTDADTLEALAFKTENPDALEFLEKLSRLNAINTYIATFCDGILSNLQNGNILYTNFNQIITATGRLSSTDPNFQNQPRGKTFPVRRAVVSRFEGGSITEVDFSQLEFRSAGELSKDKQILQDVVNGVDVHAFTRDAMNKAGANIDRQDAKPETFKPLYGGFMGTTAQMAYYQAFRIKYKEHTKWQEKTADTVLKTKTITLPTGRQYHWPHVKRNQWNGRVEYFTQIVNYPVQGLATADIVPVACIIADRKFAERGLKSVLFLTVHDSIAADTYPGEEQVVAEFLAAACLAVREEFRRRYDYGFTVPLAVEVKQGRNWLDAKVVLTKKHDYSIMQRENNKFFDDALDDIGVA
jgi:DNA polymerase I-like protein with 3'-5' exonuclease and polymerase domains